jgi:hypothetical protein
MNQFDMARLCKLYRFGCITALILMDLIRPKTLQLIFFSLSAGFSPAACSQQDYVTDISVESLWPATQELPLSPPSRLKENEFSVGIGHRQSIS